MGEVIHTGAMFSLAIDGHDLHREDKNVRRRFGAVCKALWPDEKPDVELALLGDVDTRTARRWMQGTQVPPWPVIKAVIDRMFEPIL